jgi:[ribosomal protein S5]-alanine N-acetyltransferase
MKTITPLQLLGRPLNLRSAMSSTERARLNNAAVIGEKVFLRHPSVRDREELIALNRASTRLHRNLASPPTRPEQFHAFLTRCRRIDCACFLICRLEDNAIVGTINLSQIFRGGFQNAYLGYYIGERYAGQGYMTEALKLMLRYAFLKLKLHRLEANVQPENVASISLVRRAGFVREGYSRRYLKICGQWRDHERWALIAEDWKQSQMAAKKRDATSLKARAGFAVLVNTDQRPNRATGRNSLKD